MDAIRSPHLTACERCPFDASLCLGDNWQARSDPRQGFTLSFACPYMGLRLEAPETGLGAWHLTDTTAGGSIASGEALHADQMVAQAAAALKQRGWFRPCGRGEIAQALATACDLETVD